MKIAKYKDVEFGIETVSSELLENCSSYVRVSGFIEAEFPPLSSDEQIQKHVAALDKTREQVVTEFTRKLADIDRRKSELLAITYKP